MRPVTAGQTGDGYPADLRATPVRRRPLRRSAWAAASSGPLPVALGLTVVLLMGLLLASPAAAGKGKPPQAVSKDATISLTFDDGYAPKRCLQIYDILTEYGVPATWFPNGVNVVAAPKVWRRIARQFPIANHTYHHPSLVGMSASGIKKELLSNETAIERVTGRPMVHILRPTFGAYDKRVLRVADKLGYQVVLWDVSAADTSPKGTDRGVATNALRGKDGSIILMHCGPEVTPRILPIVIARYACAGYRFATLSSLLAGKRGKRAHVDCPAPPLPARGTRATRSTSKGSQGLEGADQRTGAEAMSAEQADGGAGDMTNGLEPYYGQALTWDRCGDVAECTTVEVPRDYEDPGSGTAVIGLTRVKTGVGSKRPLIVDAGAADRAGIDLLQEFASGAGQTLLVRYHLIGLDARVRRGSDPPTCGVDPDCTAAPTVVAGRASGAETARDLDIVRSALGRKRLNFFGTSVGALAGAAYAAVFPARVGRMVLDGAVDPDALAQSLDSTLPTASSSSADGDTLAPQPILIVSATADPLHPSEWTAALSDRLPQGVLVRHDGSAAGFGQGDTCVDAAVEGFLLEGTVPAEGLVC